MEIDESFPAMPSEAKDRIIQNKQGFENSRGYTGWIFYRRLSEDLTLKNGDGSSYDKILPPFQENRLTQLIEMRIQHNQQESVRTGKPYKPVVIIDAGYGNGSALLDMADRWGDMVMLIGYGDSSLTQNDFTDESNGLHFQATEPTLRAHNIRLIDGELTEMPKRLRQAYPSGLRVDIITACMVLPYLEFYYPVKKAVQKLYRLLAPGGIFLCNFTNLKNADLNVLPEDSFELSGEHGDLALQRTESDFPNSQSPQK